MEWIKDITVPLTEGLPVWPGDARPEVRVERLEEEDATIHVTSLRIGAHTGTHLDAPLHFIPDGPTVLDLKLDDLIGDALVVDVGTAEVVDENVLKTAVGETPCSRILLRSARNRDKLKSATFFEQYTAISPGGARWLVEKGIKVVGVDYLSVGPFKEGNAETHRILLGAGVVIVEGLDLAEIEPGSYTFVCLPIKLPFDGAPCRAVLLPAGTLRR